jgi:hypothetical protein
VTAALGLDVRTTPLNFKVNKGETFTITIPILDDSAAVISMAGWSAIAQVCQEGGDQTLYYEWSAANNNLTCTDDGVVLQLLGEITAAWTWTSAMFELQITNPLGQPGIPGRGPFLAVDRLIQ